MATEEETTFESFFKDAQRKIIIVGVNSLSPHLEGSGAFFAHLLNFRPELTLKILYENDTENFQLATCVGASGSENTTSFDFLSSHKNRISGARQTAGLFREIIDAYTEADAATAAEERVDIKQLNLRMPMNIVMVDDSIYYSFSIDHVASLSDYIKAGRGSETYKKLASAVETYTSSERDGTLFLSSPGDELIWVYDSESYPRGIFPRKSFYTTDYGRYVVWVFIFNRNGQLLLQQRSKTTADNRGLWDKSVGGHVDLNDTSTSITAKRELVEEMYLPEAEFTEYVSADIGDIIDFGEWKPSKRPERCFIDNFRSLGSTDWVMFRATNHKGLPLTDRRISVRRIHKNGKIQTKKTIFHSDCFFMVAPAGHLDTQEQVEQALRFSTEKGAASGHKLTEISQLGQWIKAEEKAANENNVFTDDLMHIQAAYSGILERFSEFVKFMTKEIK